MNRTGDHANLVVKSSAWYTISNFIVKGLAFITIPIFARLMPKNAMGDYSNYLVWQDLFIIIFSVDLSSSINRARFDFKENLKSYCSTILWLGTILAVSGFLLVSLISGVIEQYTKLSTFYVGLAFLYIMFNNAYLIVISEERIFYRYKESVYLSLGYAILSTVLSVLFVVLIGDKYFGRVVGHVIPMVIIGIPLFFVVLKRSSVLKWDYVKYALLYCWPFIPHLLALKILNASDRIMITNMVSSEANATYSLANNCVSVATLFFTSLNTAVSPWVYEQLEKRDTSKLYQITIPYVLVFVLVVQAIQLIAPEALIIVGGNKYIDAKECFLPLFTSVIVQFCYAMYVNVEQYSRKTWAIAGGTVIAATVNIVLNYLLIPKFGYVVAAYTTLIGYLVLFAVHFMFVKIIGYRRVYNNKFVLLMIIYSLAMQFLIRILYNYLLLRYLVLSLLIVAAALFLHKYLHVIRTMMKKQ